MNARVPPSGAATLLAAADIAKRAGDAELSRRTPEEARELFPESPEVHFALGQSHLARDDMEAAHASFKRTVELDPAHLSGWINYGATCGELDQPDAALRAFTTALELDPASRDAASNLGVLKRESGELDEAERLFRGVVSRDPGFVFGYYNLAHCLFLQGRFEESVDQYRAGLKGDPHKTPNQNARLAWALLANGDAKAARRELKRALDRLESAEYGAFMEEAQEVLAGIEASQLNPDDVQSIRRLIAKEQA